MACLSTVHTAQSATSTPTFLCSSIFKMAKGSYFYMQIYTRCLWSWRIFSKKIKCITIGKRVHSFTKPNFKIFCWGRKLQLPTFTIFSSEAFYSILHFPNAILWRRWQLLQGGCEACPVQCLFVTNTFSVHLHGTVKGNILYKDTLCILAFGTQNLKCKNYGYDKNKKIKIRELLVPPYFN